MPTVLYIKINLNLKQLFFYTTIPINIVEFVVKKVILKGV
ncbi:hypothetical protein SYNTR_0787 [Candidatus Syntrophocurvum alkaliphilum]|uniref:Uncharacterized protein n=1 Tax=Candidatus Syntrophocurvum alkaliphilum TaxID=2293317 RepID=A0A6I6DG40_9FIRM|nr:hypothetical protein SYNTR_0787 [Candidatus Syntrophocurvum alkaliphilum]